MAKTDVNPLIEVLISNVDRVIEQNEKINEKLASQNRTLDKLTYIVDEHQLRSTRLEGIQKDCREKCDADIVIATTMAEAAQKTLNDIKRIVKWFVWIFMILIAAIEINANIAQIWSVWIAK
jgi:hypothetical protein